MLSYTIDCPGGQSHMLLSRTSNTVNKHTCGTLDSCSTDSVEACMSRGRSALCDIASLVRAASCSGFEKSRDWFSCASCFLASSSALVYGQLRGIPDLLLPGTGGRVCTGGSRLDRENPNIQDYFLGFAYRKLREYRTH